MEPAEKDKSPYLCFFGGLQGGKPAKTAPKHDKFQAITRKASIVPVITGTVAQGRAVPETPASHARAPKNERQIRTLHQPLRLVTGSDLLRVQWYSEKDALASFALV